MTDSEIHAALYEVHTAARAVQRRRACIELWRRNQAKASLRKAATSNDSDAVNALLGDIFEAACIAYRLARVGGVFHDVTVPRMVMLDQRRCAKVAMSARAATLALEPHNSDSVAAMTAEQCAHEIASTLNTPPPGWQPVNPSSSSWSEKDPLSEIAQFVEETIGAVPPKLWDIAKDRAKKCAVALASARQHKLGQKSPASLLSDDLVEKISMLAFPRATSWPKDNVPCRGNWATCGVCGETYCTVAGKDNVYSCTCARPQPTASSKTAVAVVVPTKPLPMAPGTRKPTAHAR